MYALGLKIKHSSERYTVIQDRIITDLLTLGENEFYFDKIGDFYFVAKYSDITNDKYIGLWHTIILNSANDIKNIGIKITNEEKKIGSFLIIGSDVIQGYFINNVVFGADDIDLDALSESSWVTKKIKRIKTPVQVLADNRARIKKRLLFMLVIWSVIAVFAFGYYQYFISQNQKGFDDISYIKKEQNKWQKLLNSQKIINLSQSQYLGFHTDNIINYLNCTNKISGEISFLKKSVNLKITNANTNTITCLKFLNFKILRSVKENNLLWGYK